MLRCFGCKHRNQNSRKFGKKAKAGSEAEAGSEGNLNSGAINSRNTANKGVHLRSVSPPTNDVFPPAHSHNTKSGYLSSGRGGSGGMAVRRRSSMSCISNRSSYASAESDSFGSDTSIEIQDTVRQLEVKDVGRESASVQNLVCSAEAAYGEGRLLQVQRYLQRAAEASGSTWQQLLKNGILGETGVPCSLDMRQVHQAVQQLHSCLHAAQDTSDFVGSSNDDMCIMYRHRKGDAGHSFRFEAIYDCPVSHLMAITREFDLLSSWNKYSKDSAILAQPSTRESVLYTAQWMPFPLTDLDLVVHSQWSDLLEEEDALVIALRDYTHEILLAGEGAVPSRSAQRRRIQLLPGSASILQPYPCSADGRPRTRCQVVATLDPHIDFVPQFLITFVLKVLSPFLYSTAKKMLETHFSSPDMQLPRRMAACPEVYQVIDRRFRSPPHGSEPPSAVGNS